MGRRAFSFLAAVSGCALAGFSSARAAVQADDSAIVDAILTGSGRIALAIVFASIFWVAVDLWKSSRREAASLKANLNAVESIFHDIEKIIGAKSEK